jgi:hypothetical protein
MSWGRKAEQDEHDEDDREQDERDEDTRHAVPSA